MTYSVIVRRDPSDAKLVFGKAVEELFSILACGLPLKRTGHILVGMSLRARKSLGVKTFLRTTEK